LPASDPPVIVAKPASPSPVVSSPRRILVVDDNEDAAEMLGTLLKMDGHEVFIAHRGAAAVELAGTSRPEFALIDIEMPGMNGFEVARRIRQIPSLAAVVLAALSGYSQEEDTRRSREAGFNHHLVKPADMDVLRRLIAEAVPSAADVAT